jgi:hypothetical protein
MPTLWLRGIARSAKVKVIDFSLQPAQSFHDGIQRQGLAVEHLCRQHHLVVLAQVLQQWLIRGQSHATSPGAQPADGFGGAFNVWRTAAPQP